MSTGTMSASTLILAIISIALIVAGVLVTLRDLKPKTERAAKRGRYDEAPSYPEPDTFEPATRPVATAPSPLPVPTPARPRTTARTELASYAGTGTGTGNGADVTIVHREARAQQYSASLNTVRSQPTANTAQTTARPAPPPTPGSAFAALQAAVTVIAAEGTPDAGAENQRWPTVEARWPQIDAELDTAAQRINTALQAVGLQIGPAGDAGWSFKNRGFGTYRRISLSGRSVAWLRAEANHEQSLSLKVRAHAVEHALLNATEQVPAARLGTIDALEALSRVIRPAAEYAAWISTSTATGTDQGKADAPSDLRAITIDAVKVATVALAEAQAQLRERAAPAWDGSSGRHRWPHDVVVDGQVVAGVSIDLVKRAVEVAVDPAGPMPAELARKQRLDLDGLTAHALAEALVTCAWPAVASALERNSAPAAAE